MKSRTQGFVFTMTIVTAVVLLLISALYFVFVLVSFRNSLQKTTERTASEISLSNATEAGEILTTEKVKLTAFASTLSAMINRNDILTTLSLFSDQNDEIAFFRYFNKGTEYHADGRLFLYTEDASVTQLVRDRAAVSYTKIFADSFRIQNFIALYMPIADNPEIDALVAYLSPTILFSELSMFSGDSSDYENNIANAAEYACICNRVDQIIKLKSKADGFGLKLDYNVFTSLNEMANDSDSVAVLSGAVGNRQGTVITLTIDGEKYAISAQSITGSDGNLFILNVYTSKALYEQSYDFMTQMEGALLFLLILFIAAIFYMYYLRSHLRDRREKEEKIDPVCGCLTYRYFTFHAEDMMDMNRNTKYAVLFLKVNYAQYIVSQYGDEMFRMVLRFIGQVLEKCLDSNETYGYISDGNYALIMHYADEVELMNRIRMIHAIVYNYPELKKHKNHVKVTFGVYMVKKSDKLSIYQLVDKASLALSSGDYNVDTIFLFYNEQVGDVAKRNAEIELKMEEALANGDFRVFFQPKYNLKRDVIDSAEALVRWYDPQLECYYLPGDFIRLFEQNGFIVKVDHHIFNEVCRYLSESVESGQKVVPISVNVSRVTVTQPDFVKYYLAVKKKFNIPDGVLTLEYTESFAFENYETLRTIVRQMKEGGIGSSIDDFGSGFSSYNILKELPMDELKLDRFFIMPGTDFKRDEIILGSTIRLAQQLGMKVTQEGVESLDMMDRLKEFGCNAVQGFYYSKPLPKQEFSEFINREIHTNN